MNCLKNTFIIFLLFSYSLSAQEIASFATAKFKTGDNQEWQNLTFDDSNWASIKTQIKWEKQGYVDYNGYAWYRFHFVLPSSLKENAFWKDSLLINMAKVDDVDETFFNGVKIGKTGSLPDDPAGYLGKYAVDRVYKLPLTSDLIKWDQENIVAVRVFDMHQDGGMYGSVPYVKIMEPLDAVQLTIKSSQSKKDAYVVTLADVTKNAVKGVLNIVVKDIGANKTLHQSLDNVDVKSNDKFVKLIDLPKNRLEITASFKESISSKTLETKIITSYILTPAPSVKARINGPAVLAAKPGAPFLYRIPVTGERPLRFEIKSLPKGLEVDLTTGIIRGILSTPGNYTLLITASNKHGQDQKNIVIKAGNTLALTPPLGWNSWYCWGLKVSEESVRKSVDALLLSGLVDHGWNYINIDDGWNAERTTSGPMEPNAKFKDMKALGDWIHSKGLYFGIYTSPGDRTCGGYPGTYGHERQDVEVFAKWGVDYIKYDWCSYSNIVKGDTTLISFQKPYQLLNQYIQEQNRAIVYSLCQYGLKDVWKWGDKVGGNCWRTTHDIRETWESLSAIIEMQSNLYPYAKPGHWNDPDIMVIGTIGGYKNEAYPTRLNPDEQYTHLSLWSLLTAPMLIGCDLNKLDAFTLNLLSNDEVLEINQDVLGKQAERKLHTNLCDAWVKQLSDGAMAVGIVNTSDSYKTITLPWKDFLPVNKVLSVRNVWTQKDITVSGDTFTMDVPSHGTVLLKVWPKK